MQIKEWKPAWKIKLIEEKNFEWSIFIRRCCERACARPGPRPSPGNGAVDQVIVEFE
jgi:hypothetical protein